MNFALVGASGYVAPRHMKAIKDNGHNLIAAIDINSSAGMLDRYFPHSRFFSEIELFFDYIHKSKTRSEKSRIDYVSICSPNYLHIMHVRMALVAGCNVICEKPLTIDPKDIEEIKDLERATGKKVYTLMQLRFHPSVIALKKSLDRQGFPNKIKACMTYVTHRGDWHQFSWKGSRSKSGGLAIDKGVHLFDLLVLLFGRIEDNFVHISEPDRMSGVINFEKAEVCWFLSIDVNDLPAEKIKNGDLAYRSIKIDNEEIDLSTGFIDLHTDVYRAILSGSDIVTTISVRESIELAYDIMNSKTVPIRQEAHPIIFTEK